VVSQRVGQEFELRDERAQSTAHDEAVASSTDGLLPLMTSQSSTASNHVIRRGSGKEPAKWSPSLPRGEVMVHLALDGLKWSVNERPNSITRTL